MTDFMKDELRASEVVDRATFQAELDALRPPEKARTREGDAILRSFHRYGFGMPAATRRMTAQQTI
jgi:hypothetical protein